VSSLFTNFLVISFHKLVLAVFGCGPMFLVLAREGLVLPFLPGPVSSIHLEQSGQAKAGMVSRCSSPSMLLWLRPLESEEGSLGRNRGGLCLPGLLPAGAQKPALGSLWSAAWTSCCVDELGLPCPSNKDNHACFPRTFA
jgi:hypothetical protein